VTKFYTGEYFSEKEKQSRSRFAPCGLLWLSSKSSK